MAIRIDNNKCFAYKGIGKCSALVSSLARCKGCPFFKTKEEYEEGLRKYPMAGHIPDEK